MFSPGRRKDSVQWVFAEKYELGSQQYHCTRSTGELYTQLVPLGHITAGTRISLDP
jgi:hypothetical protein